MNFKKISLSLVLVLCVNSCIFADGNIGIGKDPSQLENYAAKELKRYIYLLSDEVWNIQRSSDEIKNDGFVIGTAQSNSLIKKFTEQNLIELTPAQPGRQGYILKTIKYKGNDLIIIAANEPIGCLYGVYGLLEDYYNIGFYFSGDVFSSKYKPFKIKKVDDIITPTLYIRGFLPWTNFPQSATVYSWEDWKFIIDQAAKMRMNFIHIHNYNGMKGHNEMYHNFEYKDFMSRVWMPTARTGHSWAGPAFDITEYRFGAGDLFGDYDFGTDATLHNESLSNEEVFAKGSSLFSKVIDYAHKRGVRIGLGLDIDLIPSEYKKIGAEASDMEIIKARVDQNTSDYPNLDYLLCFQSEGSRRGGEEFYKKWRKMIMTWYNLFKEKSPNTRLCVSGWGLDPESIAELPEDIICAPIAGYSDKFQDGSIFGDREYWGCPWMEKDGNGSQHYYPYGTHLSNTIEAYQNRSDNTKGMYCLTWRLTDAIEPKISYIAKAPWHSEEKYKTSYDVYHEYATLNYGEKCADEITAIINENEPFAVNFGECAHTPQFSGSRRKCVVSNLFNIDKFLLKKDTGETKKLEAVDYSNKGGHLKESETFLRNIRRDSWVEFSNVDLNGIKIISAMASAADYSGEIQIIIDSLEGKIIGEIDVEASGQWRNWQEFSTDIERTEGFHDLYFVFLPVKDNDLEKAKEQLKVIDQCLARLKDAGRISRLKMLRCRIEAAKNFIELDMNFPDLTWGQLPGPFDSWAENFMYRVNDISSLGNVQSSQNRLVNLNYLPKVKKIIQEQMIKPPSHVTARGTENGAVIRWQNEQVNPFGFNIYRDGKLLTEEPLPGTAREFKDKNVNGNFRYTVQTVDHYDRFSYHSIGDKCLAGDADNEKPFITLISAPSSAIQGQSVNVEALVLDNRDYAQISAELYYRAIGDESWNKKQMNRKVKAIFDAPIFTEAESGIIEYYVKVSDGKNINYFPANVPETTCSLVTTAKTEKDRISSPELETVGKTLKINSKENPYWFKIYRSKDKNFQADGSTYVTYLAGTTNEFKDNGFGFDGLPLKGKYYYKVTAVDKNDFESKPSDKVSIEW